MNVFRRLFLGDHCSNTHLEIHQSMPNCATNRIEAKCILSYQTFIWGLSFLIRTEVRFARLASIKYKRLDYVVIKG